LECLRELCCDQYQGFLRSEAVSAGEIESAIRSMLAAGTERSNTPVAATQSKLAQLDQVGLPIPVEWR
jgi:hypothetical protein